MFECVINISEGRESERLAAFALAAGPSLRNQHADPHHHRSVFTLINDPVPLVRDVHRLIEQAVEMVDLRTHDGVHPRLGVVDVVPFVALHDEQAPTAVILRTETAEWMADELAVPTFLYGPERSLPDVRRHAFVDLAPDFGPSLPHPRAGASAVGARPVLIAWNMWIHQLDMEDARDIAREIRSRSVRALGLPVGDATQISCNVLDVHATRLSVIYDRVRELLPQHAGIVKAELVGLAPRAALELESPLRWEELDLHPEATIEYQLGR